MGIRNEQRQLSITTGPEAHAGIARALDADAGLFARIFFRGIHDETLPLTRLNYARDLNIFFDFLLEFKPSLAGKRRRDLDLADMANVTLDDLEVFMDHLTYYERENKSLMDREAAKERKLSALRSLFKYLFKKQRIPSNVAALVDMPKRHEKVITRLEVDEVARLLDLVEDGEQLTPRQRSFHQQTKERDLALISLLLGTGIRVSECVGLNISDLGLFHQRLSRGAQGRRGGHPLLPHGGGKGPARLSGKARANAGPAGS